jgi:hypothetical protein
LTLPDLVLSFAALLGSVIHFHVVGHAV